MWSDYLDLQFNKAGPVVAAAVDVAKDSVSELAVSIRQLLMSVAP